VEDRGFTLVEILIVIVILGILSTVVVFSVRGITDRGDDSANQADERTLISAQEAYFAQNGRYAPEATLVDRGFIRSQSTLHDVTVTTDGRGYSIVDVAAP
jgi:prepilin-type N-terminal cleavage/methylation domain-containing protein